MRPTIVWPILAALAAALLLAPTVAAKDGRDIRVAGTCSASTTSKLKLSPEDGGIEVEFEVDQNRNGVRWRVVLLRNGVRVAGRTAVTRAPSGSFESRFLAAGPGGRFVARALSPSGERCVARASLA